MRSFSITKAIQRFIKKINQIKSDFRRNPKITKFKKRASQSRVRCSGSGTTIEVSLAFRNEVGTKDETSASDLYLKGLNTKTGKEVNFYNELTWDFRMKELRNQGKGHEWVLRVSDSEGTVLFNNSEVHGSSLGDGMYLCNLDKIKAVNDKTKLGVERSVASIAFEFGKDCKQESGKEICDIKIADNVGLKERNFSAFRNSLGGKDGNSANDLYLKGINKTTGAEVKFDEDITGDHHQTSSSGHRGEKLWRLKVYKGSGNVRLHNLSGNTGRHYDDDGLTCTGHKFEIVKETYGGDWEKYISEISFVLLDCNSLTGKGICDIKI